MMKPQRLVRQPLEIGAFLSGMALVPWLPRRAVLRLAGTLGDAAFCLDKRSRRIAQANLRAIFPAADGNGKTLSVVRQAFRTIALTYLDLYWFSRHSRSRLRRHVVFDPSFEGVFQNTPAIVVCAHFGNWEVVGLASGLAGAPALSVAAPLRNRVLNHWLHRLRTSTGQQNIPREGAARGLLRALRDGRRVALLLDQNTRIRRGGMWVPFFGLPVPVSRIVELLAARTGAPVISAYGYPAENGDYRAVAGPLLKSADTAQSPGSLTATLMQDLEARIRENPELWLWMYKRWKYVAPGADPGKYPVYARFRPE